MPNNRQKIDKNAKKPPIIYRQLSGALHIKELFMFTLNSNIV